ncbi:MAG: hypothetical protein U0350_04730 [Caldilineaceae bacterium]
MSYFFVQDQELQNSTQPPVGMEPLPKRIDWLLPPLITDLHRSFKMWGATGYSPGPVSPDRVWFAKDGRLAFTFPRNAAPKKLMDVGLAPDLAAWLVLLDKWMETFVVVARARALWDVQALVGALTFMTPAFLPRALVVQPPNNWARVAQALAAAIADGPMSGAPNNRHWQQADVQVQKPSV